MCVSGYFQVVRERVCVCFLCVVREVGGSCLYKCMATYMCVGATMCHIQHMLPSSSPFGGRLSFGTQPDSPWHDLGGQHGATLPGATQFSLGPWEGLRSVCVFTVTVCVPVWAGRWTAPHTDTCNDKYIPTYWNVYTLFIYTCSRGVA